MEATQQLLQAINANLRYLKRNDVSYTELLSKLNDEIWSYASSVNTDPLAAPPTTPQHRVNDVHFVVNRKYAVPGYANIYVKAPDNDQIAYVYDRVNDTQLPVHWESNNGHPYVTINSKRIGVYAVIAAAYYHQPIPEGDKSAKVVDHINQNPYDERISNLRIVSRTVNSNNTHDNVILISPDHLPDDTIELNVPTLTKTNREFISRSNFIYSPSHNCIYLFDDDSEMYKAWRANYCYHDEDYYFYISYRQTNFRKGNYCVIKASDIDINAIA